MKRYLIPTLLIAFVVALGACSDQPQPTAPAVDSTQPTTDIPSQYEALLQRYQQGDYLFDVEKPSVPLTVNPADSSWDVYMITMVWGSFSPDPANPLPPVDWSGRLLFTGAGEFSNVFPINFEPGQDSLLPISSPVSLITWQSFTSDDIDGIQALLFVNPNSIATVVPELAVETAPVSFRYLLEDLTRLQAFYPYGTGGLAIQVMKLPRPDCPHGRMYGHWVRDTLDDFHGHFGGLWVNHLGCPIGAFKGRFGVNDAGEWLFEGRILNYRGEAIGRMFGHWVYTDLALCPTCGTRFGEFEGRFELDSGRTGTLAGVFGNHVDFMAPRALRLRGHWEMDCPSVDSSPR